MRYGILLVWTVLCAVAQSEVDHPAITSYPGSRILVHRQLEFEEYPLTLSLHAGGERITLEGRVTRIQYRNPTGRSALEIFRNYQGALQQAGAKTLFTCNPDQCSAWPLYREQKLKNMGNQGCHGIVARFVHANRETHAVVAVSAAVHWIHIMETKPLDSGLVTVDAKVMEESLGRDGRISLHSILFQTGLAAIKPESGGTIAEIAKLLTNKPELNLDIVGHTDDTGTADGNLKLSAERAKAVVSELVRSFRIPIGRLRPRGAGQSSPVAPNSSDDGRAKNRRVELVAQK